MVRCGRNLAFRRGSPARRGERERQRAQRALPGQAAGELLLYLRAAESRGCVLSRGPNDHIRVFLFCFVLVLSVLVFWPHGAACGILVP